MNDSTEMNIPESAPVKDSVEHTAAARTAGSAAAMRAPREPREPLVRLPDQVEFIAALVQELETTLEQTVPDAYFNMALQLVSDHLAGRLVTGTSLVAASRVPYATGMRKLREMIDAGLVEQRPRTRSGKSFSLHPSTELLDRFDSLATRIRRLAQDQVRAQGSGTAESEYYYGGTYLESRTIHPPKALAKPLNLPGGLRALVHGDPTFMVMKDLKRQFEQLCGTEIHQRAFSIDRLRLEALRNAERRVSRYDLVAFDLPWVGEFAEKGILLPLDTCIDLERFDPGDFHTAGWEAAHWGGRSYGIPAQTTPELLFYRTDLFAEAGLAPPATTADVLRAARHFHAPARGRYGIAWNAARGTALGHTFLMVCADFGQPVVEMPRLAGRYDAGALAGQRPVPTLDTDRAEAAAEFLMALLDVSPPNILSMSWYERVRPYAAGTVPMAYGYTLLAPYFELAADSPANGRTGFLPHPCGPDALPLAPVGGYALGIPANLPAERREAAAEALLVFTSPEAQKLYALNGSRTAPRYSVGADRDVRALSPIFEAVDAMSWHDELQYWPRPPIPQITALIEICGEELHDMLRGLVRPREALQRAQKRAEQALAR